MENLLSHKQWCWLSLDGIAAQMAIEETKAKLGLRPKGCVFEAYVRGFVFQTRHQLCPGQLGNSVSRDNHANLSAEGQQA